MITPGMAFQSGVLSGSTIDQVRAMIRGRKFDLQRTAVAYATAEGCKTLSDLFTRESASYRACKKLWLLSFDYGFTQPSALELLRGMPNSEVRIFDGARVIGRPLLRPIQSYHPKVYTVSDPHKKLFGAVVGSGNLTRGGLSAGVEASSLLLEKPVGPASREFDGWWNNLWRRSADLSDDLLSKYRLARRSAPTRPSPPGTTRTEVREEPAEAQPAQPVPAPDLADASHLWFENWRFPRDGGRSGGNLNGGSRNQADLPLQGSPERYFGLDHAGVATDTILGRINLRTPSGDQTWPDMWVKFSNNQQIRIMLPTEAQGGWDYNETVVILNRTDEPNLYVIEVFPIISPEGEWCQRMSREQSASYQARGSARRWGVFKV